MIKHSVHTKTIVIVGYFVLVSLAILGIILIYMELLKFSKASEPTPEREELVIISNTLATMYQAEGTAGLLTVVAVPELKQEYDSLMNNTLHHIEQLKEISSEPQLNFHLDSVIVLLKEKQKNTWRMIMLLDSIESKTIKDITKSTILSKKDLNELNELLIKKTQQIEDTTILKTKKKGFLRRMGDAIRNKPDSTTQISRNTIENFGSVIVPTLTDTVAEYINEVYSVTQKRNADIIRRLVARQNQLYRTNEMLTTEINQIMRDIEKREYQSTMNMINGKTETIRRSSRIVSIIGLLASGMTIIFLSLSLRSISQGQRLQKEVERAKKYAENLLLSREQLLLTITHDIKAPISSIIGYIELLLKDKPQKKEVYYVENMLHSAEHILDLVRNLLDYHALESKKQEINPMTFAPCVLANDIYQSFIPLANKKNLKFQFECNIYNRKSYSSDPYRIRQILNNLISNAIKFTPEKGSILFTVSAMDEGEQTTLVLSVKDNGPGMSEEEKSMVFEEFRRFNYSIEGSGLGLPITHRLVLLLKGSITIESNPGKGSNFTVKIPLMPSKEKMKSSVSPFPIADDNTIIDVDINKKILFIDDDFVQLNLFSELLKQEGFSPTVCASSTEALVLLQKNHFDIVFSDIQMPDMNGFGLVEHIRTANFDNSASIPVIALSASSNISEQKFKEAGFSGFLAKPFTSKQLFYTIEQFIGNQIQNKDLPPDSRVSGFDSLVEFAANDKGAALAIIQSFIDESKKNIKILKNASKQNDWDSIKQTSHKMLPVIRMITTGKLISILEEYEQGNQPKEDMTTFLNLLEKQIEKAELFKKTLTL